MVNIIGRSPEEIASEERLSKLEKIAQEVCGEKLKINVSLGNIYLRSFELSDYEPKICVNLSLEKNKIHAYSILYLEDAVTLAKAYESSGETEFTVKKDYDE